MLRHRKARPHWHAWSPAAGAMSIRGLFHRRIAASPPPPAALMAYSIDGATDGAIQDILCPHTQNSTCGAFWDFRPPHFEGVWRVPIWPPEWNVGESRGALLKS
jgi:hypothetical protein